jgi:hypothetical protein
MGNRGSLSGTCSLVVKHISNLVLCIQNLLSEAILIAVNLFFSDSCVQKKIYYFAMPDDRWWRSLSPFCAGL